MSAVGLLPDAAVVHELDLPLDDLLPVLGVLHRRALEVEVLRVDGLRVEDLVELGPDVLEPVVPLGARAVVAQRLDVDHARDVRRAGTVVLLADDPALVVDDVRAAAEGVDGRRLLGEEVVRPHVGGHDEHVVVERARPALDLEHLVARCGVRVGGAVDDLGAVQRERPRVLGIGALVRHHDAEPADLRLRHGPEGVEGPAVLLDPPVVDVVRADRVLDREERRDLVMFEDDSAARVDDEPDVEEAVFQVGVLGLRLRYDERVVLLRDLAERLGFADGAVLSWCRARHALSRRPRSSITRTATSPPRFRTVTSWRGNAETSIAARDATCSERTSRQPYSFVSCSRRLATWTVSPTAVR